MNFKVFILNSLSVPLFDIRYFDFFIMFVIPTFFSDLSLSLRYLTFSV